MHGNTRKYNNYYINKQNYKIYIIIIVVYYTFIINSIILRCMLLSLQCKYSNLKVKTYIKSETIMLFYYLIKQINYTKMIKKTCL